MLDARTAGKLARKIGPNESLRASRDGSSLPLKGTPIPHNLATIDGKPAMMFVGQPPWHNLGTHFDNPPTSAEEVIRAAGLDWQVVKKPVYACDGGHFCAIPGSQGIRSRSGASSAIRSTPRTRASDTTAAPSALA